MKVETQEQLEYFEYLCDMVDVESWQGLTWWKLAGALFDEDWPEIMVESPTEFTDFPRAMDGIRLRSDYEDRYYDGEHQEELEGPVTMLEVMIGMARWMEFSVDSVRDNDTVAAMFWQLVRNIGLGHLADSDWYSGGDAEVAEAMRRVKYHDISPNGNGGFFPRTSTKIDVRGQTLWSQMQGWLIERYA